MSKSRARLLAELLNSAGRVKKDRSDLAGADSIIDLDTLPTITNAKLENSSISVAGHSVSLGGSVSLDTADISEHTDYPYFTNARARGAISVSGSTISYNSSTGVITSTANNYVLPFTDNSSNWNTAYGWGDHSTAGYLTSFTETNDLSSAVTWANVPNANITESSVTQHEAALSITESQISDFGTYLTSHQSLAAYAPLASPALTGTPTAPTQAAGNNTTRLATTAFVTTAVDNIVDAAPGTLNTLNELAAALGDDANFSTTVTNSIATKLPLAGGTMTGELKTRALTIINPVTTGKVEIGTIANDQQNGYVRGSIIFSRNENQITFDTSTDNWVHAGGSSTDWSMIAHHSSGISFYTGSSVASSTSYTNTQFASAYKWLEVPSTKIADFKVRPTVAGNNIWHAGDFTSTDINNWDAAYTYSQVGHLALAGGTMTGTLNMGANAITSTGTISSGAITSTGTGTFNNRVSFTEDDVTSMSTGIKTLNNGGLSIELDENNEVTSTDFRVRLDRSSGNSQLVLDASGNLDIEGALTAAEQSVFTGTSISGTPNTNAQLVAADSGVAGIAIQTNDGGSSYVWFGDTTDNAVGRIKYDHSADEFTFRAGATDNVFEIDSSGMGKLTQLTLKGTSDNLTFTDTGGDWSIKNAQQNNGIVIYDGGSGVEIHYNNAAVAEFDSVGGMNIVSGELRMGGTTRIGGAGAGTFSDLTLSDGSPLLTLSDTSNGGGGGAFSVIKFKNTAGDAIAIGYTDDDSSGSDLYISTNAAGTYGGYMGLDAAGIADARADIILEPKTDVRIATGGLKVGTTTVIDSSRNLTNINSMHVTGTSGIGIGTSPSGFGAGVSTMLLQGTSSTNGRAGALWFKEYDGTTTSALYSTDGADGYGTVLASYQGDLKLATGSLTGTALTIDSSQNATFAGTISSGAITSSGKVKGASLETDRYIYHAGDTNTYIDFGADEINFHAGGGANEERLIVTASQITANRPMLIEKSTINGELLHLKNTYDGGYRDDLIIENTNDRDAGLTIKTVGGQYEMWLDSNGDDSLIFSAGDNTTDITMELYQNKNVDIGGNLNVVGTISSGAITASGNIRLNKEGTADASNQIYASRDLEFLASGWDVNNSVARDVMWKVRNVPTASNYPDYDLQFIESDQGSDYVKFQLHGRGSTNHTDPMAATFYGNVDVAAGTGGTNAGDGNLTVTGSVSGGTFKLGATTIIDASSNLTSIGTISSGAITSTGSSLINTLQVGTNTQQNSYGRLQVNQSANVDEAGIGILSQNAGRSMRLWVDETHSYINSGNAGSGFLYFNQDVRVTSDGNFERIGSHISGCQIGGYDAIENSREKSNPIHVIGSNYMPTATSVANMWGIGFTRGSGYFADLSWTNGDGWGLYAAAGAARIFLDAENGVLEGTGGIAINGTSVIDASRNLTNIGTISSGAITSSGAGSFNTMQVTSSESAGTSSGINFLVSDTVSNQSFTGVRIDHNASGSQAHTADNSHVALLIDMDTTQTGGDISNENRAYGIQVDVRGTGDTDARYGVYSYAETQHSAGTVTNNIAVYGYAVADDTGTGRTTNNIAGQFLAYEYGTGTGGSNTHYAIFAKTLLTSAADKDTSSATGVYGEIEIDTSGTATTLSNAYVFQAQFDNDSSDTTINTSYLFYGNYAGTFPSTAYGVYIADVVDNYFGGYVRSLTGFKINQTEVIDENRNLTNIGTISSGAITSSGKIVGTELEINSSATSGYLAGNASIATNGYIMATALLNEPETGTGATGITFGNGPTLGSDQISLITGGLRRLYIDNSGDLDFGNGNFSSVGTISSNGAFKSDSEFAFLTGASGAQTAQMGGLGIGSSYSAYPAYAGEVNVQTGYRVGGTRVIDSSRNLTNIANLGGGDGNFARLGRTYNTATYFEVGYGSGAVGLTINDGGGNAQLTFNHTDETADANGSSARIRCDVDSSGADILFLLEDTVTSGFVETNNMVQALTVATGGISAAGNVTAYSSDRRLKENFAHIESPLEKIAQLHGMTFDWKDIVDDLKFKPTHRKNDVGLIAQDVQAVVPQAVAPAPFDQARTEDGTGYYSKSGQEYMTVQLERLVPLLVEGIKEQQSQIDAQQQQINQLTNLVNTLTKEKS